MKNVIPISIYGEKKNLDFDEKLRFYKKNLAIEFIDNNEGYRLFSEDLDIKGAKSFVPSTYEQMYHLCVSQKSPHYYENIERNMPVKFHLDIDLKVNINKKVRLDRIFNKTIKESIDMFNNEFKKNNNIDDPQIIILKSDYIKTDNDLYKISAHIIYNNVIFDNIYDMKHFMLKIKSQLIDNKTIDKNIYRVGCFILLHCSKKGKINKLRFNRGINYTVENDEKLFYDTMVTHLYKDQKVHRIINNFEVDIKFKKEYFLKNAIKRNNKLNNFFYLFTDLELNKLLKMVEKIDLKEINNYNSWLLITYSFIDLHNNIDKKYQQKVYDIWEDLCRRGLNYNKSENKKYFFSLELDYINANYIPIVINSKFRFKKVIKYDYIKPQFNDYDIDKLNCRFIAQDIYDKIHDKDVIAIKSPPGTGKTTLLNKIFNIEQIDNKNVNNFKHPIISITSRKNLAEKHANDLGVFYYKNDEVYLFDVDKVAITVNSLIKINEEKFKDCYLILDETSKILNYFKSDILNGIRYDVYEIFCTIIKNAKKIILLDADLAEIDLKTIMNIRNKKSSYYLAINEYKTKKNINAYFYDNPHIVAEMLINDFINKVPFICALDSLTRLKQIVNEIKKKAIDMNIINQIDKLLKVYSSEQDDNTIDINIIRKRLAVFYSPIIIYGIDFNSDIPRKVYVFTFKKILTPCEVNQQMQRERNQKEIHIFINQNVGYLKYETSEHFKKNVQNRISKYNETINEIMEINNISTLDDHKDDNLKKIFNDMYVESTFIEETTKIHMEYYLKNILQDMGYNLIDKKDSTNFKLENNKQFNDKNNIVDDFQMDKEVNSKTKDKIIRRMEIMNIKKDQLNDFNKDIILNDTKFNDYLNLKRYLNNKIDDKIIENNKNELDECGSNNIYLKLREFKKIVTVLGIKNDIEFNYDKDCKKFKNIIEDKYILDNINEAKKMFRFNSIKYMNFNKEGGYLRLYCMAISMCRQLFGNKLLNTKIDNMKGKQRKIYKYFIDKKYLANVKSN